VQLKGHRNRWPFSSQANTGRQGTVSRRLKLILAGLTAALMLMMTIASASANRLSLSNRNFRAVWTNLELQSAAGTVRCPLTLEGSFHYNTIAKRESALIGHVSRASVNNGACTNGHATIIQERLPWHVTYGGFTGTLPRITGVKLNLINATFRVEIGGLACTTQTTTANPAKGIVNLTAGVAESLRADETAGIPLRGSFLCEIGGEGRFRGTTTSLTLLGNTTRITVTLI